MLTTYEQYAKRPIAEINEGKPISTLDSAVISIDKNSEANQEPLIDMRYSGVYAVNFWENCTDLHPMYGQTFDGEGVFLRESVAKKIIEADKELQNVTKGKMRLMLIDGTRSLNFQSQLFNFFYKNALKNHKGDEKAAETEALQYCSRPDFSSDRPTIHATGAAVDLIAVDGEGCVVNMGSFLGNAAPESNTRFYEDKLIKNGKLSDYEMEALVNRRVFHHVLKSCGLVNLPSEYWHVGSGDVMSRYVEYLQTGEKNDAVYDKAPSLTEKQVKMSKAPRSVAEQKIVENFRRSYENNVADYFAKEKKMMAKHLSRERGPERMGK